MSGLQGTAGQPPEPPPGGAQQLLQQQPPAAAGELQPAAPAVLAPAALAMYQQQPLVAQESDMEASDSEAQGDAAMAAAFEAASDSDSGGGGGGGAGGAGAGGGEHSEDLDLSEEGGGMEDEFDLSGEFGEMDSEDAMEDEEDEWEDEWEELEEVEGMLQGNEFLLDELDQIGEAPVLSNELLAAVDDSVPAPPGFSYLVTHVPRRLSMPAACAHFQTSDAITAMALGGGGSGEAGGGAGAGTSGAAGAAAGSAAGSGVAAAAAAQQQQQQQQAVQGQGLQEQALVSNGKGLSLYRLPQTQEGGPQLLASTSTHFEHYSIARSPDGSWVAVSGDRGLVTLFRLQPQQQLQQHPAQPQPGQQQAQKQQQPLPSSLFVPASAAASSARAGSGSGAADGAGPGPGSSDAGAGGVSCGGWAFVHVATFACVQRMHLAMANCVRFGYFGGALRLLVSCQEESVYLLNLPEVHSKRPGGTGGTGGSGAAGAGVAAAASTAGGGGAAAGAGVGQQQAQQGQERLPAQPWRELLVTGLQDWALEPQAQPDEEAMFEQGSLEAPGLAPGRVVMLWHGPAADPSQQPQRGQVLGSADTASLVVRFAIGRMIDSGPVNTAQSSPDGSWLALGLDNAMVTLLPSGPDYHMRPAVRLGLGGGGLAQTIKQEQVNAGVHTLGCQYCAWSSDGALLAASFDRLRLVLVWDVHAATRGATRAALAAAALGRNQPSSLAPVPSGPSGRAPILRFSFGAIWGASMLGVPLPPLALSFTPWDPQQLLVAQGAGYMHVIDLRARQQGKQQQQQRRQQQRRSSVGAGGQTGASGSSGVQQQGQEGQEGPQPRTTRACLRERVVVHVGGQEAGPLARIHGLALLPSGRLLVASSAEAFQYQLLVPSSWSPWQHGCYPGSFRRAVRTLLLGAHVSSSAAAPAAAAAAAAASTAVAEQHQAGGGCPLQQLPQAVLEHIVRLAAFPLAAWASVGGT